jgi:hypothetical protein
LSASLNLSRALIVLAPRSVVHDTITPILETFN